jgi:hypothetical protein
MFALKNDLAAVIHSENNLEYTTQYHELLVYTAGGDISVGSTV